MHKALCRQELQRHCHHHTRGTLETVEPMESLLLALLAGTDALGMPFLREEMKDIWHEQGHHVKCLQDPPTIQLYTETARPVKGSVSLSVYRYARGSREVPSEIAFFNPNTAEKIYGLGILSNSFIIIGSFLAHQLVLSTITSTSWIWFYQVEYSTR